MNISIRSEADSRILIYPLIRALYNFGTICVITSNVNMKRLIDVDTMEGGFRNVRVIVQPDGDLEEAMNSDDMYKGKYDFTIFDNMGATDYDMEFIIITSRVSESYLQDIVWIIGEEGTHVFRFGAGAPASKDKDKKSKDNKKPKKKGKKGEEAEDDEQEDEDVFSNNVIDAKANQAKVSGFNEDGSIKNKWTAEKTDAEILNEKLAQAQATVLPFPNFEDIEKMESRWVLPKIEGKLAKALYKVIGPVINVDERQFTKGVSTVDEGGYFISGADVR